MAERLTVEDVVSVLTRWMEGLKAELKRFGDERRRYKRGSLYEVFLCGVEQGVFYALNYPKAGIILTEDLVKSRERDRVVGR